VERYVFFGSPESRLAQYALPSFIEPNLAPALVNDAIGRVLRAQHLEYTASLRQRHDIRNTMCVFQGFRDFGDAFYTLAQNATRYHTFLILLLHSASIKSIPEALNDLVTQYFILPVKRNSEARLMRLIGKTLFLPSNDADHVVAIDVVDNFSQDWSLEDTPMPDVPFKIGSRELFKEDTERQKALRRQSVPTAQRNNVNETIEQLRRASRPISRETFGAT